MGDSVDFDVKNYSTQDLLHILNLQDEIPLSKAKIIDRVQIFIDKFKSNPEYERFFLDVRTELLKEKDEFNTQNTYTIEESNEKITDFTSENNVISDEVHNTITQPPEKSVLTSNTPFQQGMRNPTKRNLTTRTINFNSSFRTILNTNAVKCEELSILSIVYDSNNITINHSTTQNWLKVGDSITLENTINGTYDGTYQILSIAENKLSLTVESSLTVGQNTQQGIIQSFTQNNNNQLDKSSDYTVTLSEPINNVLDISLKEIEIPISWYVFSKDYGTSSFHINDTEYLIEDGNYNSDKLIQSINTSISGSNCLLAYNPVNKKITITNNSGSSVSIYWYKKDSMSGCENGGGQKVDYNFGWLLGFRQTTYVVNNGESIMGEAVLNTNGSRYLLLSVDDFVNNKPNQSIISISNNQNVWNMPNYYNKHSMEKDCEPQIQEKGCTNIVNNQDSIENLTKAQKYTIDQIKLAMSGVNVDRYDSPNSSDILSRIQIPYNTNYNEDLKYFTYKNENPEDKRIYFGPVSLRTFRIRLLNEKGYIINLNNIDWSFSAQITQIYQYN
tara:strand:- start:6492 stop:8168 length:1677 start_codon:yes stop_codon:yes gene_type:complete